MSSAAEIAFKIFTSDPKEEESVSFGITEDMDLTEIFEMLLMIFTEGMKIKHGDDNGKVDLNSLREKDFELFQKYFNSFGFNCNYKLYKPSEQLKMDFNARKYTNITMTRSTQLKDLILPLKCGPCVFEISFDFFRKPASCNQSA
jgi:hypothetical protein